MKQLVSDTEVGGFAKAHPAIVALICLLLFPDQESGLIRTDLAQAHRSDADLSKCHLDLPIVVGCSKFAGAI